MFAGTGAVRHSPGACGSASQNSAKSKGLTDDEIARHVNLSPRTVRAVRKRFCAGNLETALYDAPRCGAPATFTPRQQQQVVALACTDPPEGRTRWTLELLCEHAAKRGFVKSVSKSEVALWLKDHDMKPVAKKTWCIPKLIAEFRERMEDILDQYEQPYDPKEPVICLEGACQGLRGASGC